MKQKIQNLPTEPLLEPSRGKVGPKSDPCLKLAGVKIRNFTQRGVSLLLVLAVLTVLAIIGSSFVYVMRTELVAATNFADRFKADYVAESGINNATQALVSLMTTSQGELVPYGIETSSSDTTQTLMSPGQKIQQIKSSGFLLSSVTSGTNPKVVITDEESKLNLLVACDTEKYHTQGGLNLLQFLTVRLDHAGFINASYVAQTVANQLHTAYIESKLKSADAIRTVVDDTVYNAIGEYVTVYSATPNVDKNQQKKVNINTATATQIYNKLHPTLGNQKAAQLAVNIVDFRDADSIPTLLTVAGTTYRGVERVPYINEVMPYSSTPDENGNDGQYIELYNPYDENIIVDGWKIDGRFGSIDLYGEVPAKGSFIITDEYQDDADYDGGTPDGSNFLNNYGSVPSAQLVVNENLSLSKTGDALKLYDASGNLVDEIIYSSAEKNISWEKNDPRVNQLFTASGGTPYARNNAYAPPLGTADEAALAYISNLPYGGIGDLGYVGASYPNYPWVTVSIDTGATGIRFADIVDLLSSTADDRIIGQININTAPAEVLLAIPGMTPSLAEEIVNYRTIHGKFNEITNLAAIAGYCGLENADDDNDGTIDDENEKQSLFRQMADWLSVRSNIFSIRSAGTVNKDKVAVSTSSLLVVIDRSQNPVKILFRKRI
ncbi:MAG: helix-hairpin-helix domain-containing protein [bacterium]|nr:helix-hairpin-helix domain-containing protein [bacterium]